MIVFENLSKQERLSACKAVNATSEEKQKIMYNGVKKTLEIISNRCNTRKAWNIAWKISVGNYLINSPEEIANYCIKISEVRS